MKFAYKIWIEREDEAAFGKGIYRILSLVDEKGSLNKAAQEMKMSYRAVWGLVRLYEKRIGADLVEKGRHGRNRTYLTPRALRIMKCYEDVMRLMEGLSSKAPVKKLLKSMEVE